ncbi:hypothetical protein [Amycolatopsis rubida]|uniref:hypothetical protein n=1 Tax=Amycolatopsis rubida TaxID=112413 RepID=UPI00116063E2|nr:hypothetical protein [Amycolatopsis rubida]
MSWRSKHALANRGQVSMLATTIRASTVSGVVEVSGPRCGWLFEPGRSPPGKPECGPTARHRAAS